MKVASLTVSTSLTSQLNSKKDHFFDQFKIYLNLFLNFSIKRVNIISTLIIFLRKNKASSYFISAFLYQAYFILILIKFTVFSTLHNYYCCHLF